MKHKNGRRFKLIILVIVWLIFGFNESFIKHEIEVYIQKVFDQFDLSSTFQIRLGSINVVSPFSNSRLLTMVSSAIFYCSLPVAFIHEYYMNTNITKVTIGLYSILSILTLFLYGFGLFYEPLILIAKKVSGMILSPMPLVILIPALSLVKSSNETKRLEVNT